MIIYIIGACVVFMLSMIVLIHTAFKSYEAWKKSLELDGISFDETFWKYLTQDDVAVMDGQLKVIFALLIALLWPVTMPIFSLALLAYFIYVVALKPILNKINKNA